MRHLLLAWILAFASLGSAADAGAADAVRETRVATGFSKIEIDGQADVILRQGTTEGVTIEAAAQALRQIETEVHGRTLEITLIDQRHWWDWIFGDGPTHSPRITINFINLEKVEAAGSIRISAPTR